MLEDFTNNGKIDLILKYKEQVYALELKSSRDMYDYNRGLSGPLIMESNWD